MAVNDLLSQLLGTAFNFASDYVKAAAPKCGFCGKGPALPCSCGHAACERHVFVNVVYQKALCADCAESLGVMLDDYDTGEDDYEDEYDDDPEPEPEPEPRPRRRQKAQPKRKARARPEPPPEYTDSQIRAAFSLLGLDRRTADEAMVNKAFRQNALDCHPDLHQNDPKAKRRFQGLQKAKEICLAIIAAKGTAP